MEQDLMILLLFYCKDAIISIMSEFGKKRLVDFYSDPSYINVNHGSYGYTPKAVMQYKRYLEEECESNTEKWFRRESEMYINDMRGFIANRIHCPTKNVFIVQNATDAINCIAKSIPWKAGEVILLPNIAYASIRKTINVIQQRYNLTLVDITITAADLQSSEAFQLKVEEFVNSYPKKIKMVVMDHISSTTGTTLPVETLREFFEEKGVIFVVDGAHSPGNIDFSIADIAPNAYFGNFHKWSFCPKNASFLYIDDKLREVVKPAITGNFHGEGPQRQFYWTGTRDFTSYLSIKKGIEYHESFGLNKVVSYNHSLAQQAAKRIAQIWGTKLLTNDTRMYNNMISIQAPSNDHALCHRIAMDMLYEVNCFPHFIAFDGKVYFRISTQIYNQLSDFEFAANKFVEYLKKYQQKEEKVQQK